MSREDLQIPSAPGPRWTFVTARGRIGVPQMRNFEPWTIQCVDAETTFSLANASDEAVHGLTKRLDDFGLEFVKVERLSSAELSARNDAAEACL
jgi:hypothetical protein